MQKSYLEVCKFLRVAHYSKLILSKIMHKSWISRTLSVNCSLGLLISTDGGLINSSCQIRSEQISMTECMPTNHKSMTQKRNRKGLSCKVCKGWDTKTRINQHYQVNRICLAIHKLIAPTQILVKVLWNISIIQYNSWRMEIDQSHKILCPILLETWLSLMDSKI